MFDNFRDVALFKLRLGAGLICDDVIKHIFENNKMSLHGVTSVYDM